jgi:hypothetical protein
MPKGRPKEINGIGIVIGVGGGFSDMEVRNCYEAERDCSLEQHSSQLLHGTFWSTIETDCGFYFGIRKISSQENREIES